MFQDRREAGITARFFLFSRTRLAHALRAVSSRNAQALFCYCDYRKTSYNLRAMRKYLANHPRDSGAYMPEEVAALAAICDQVTAELNITERVDIDLVASRILSLYEGGVRDPAEIVRTVVALALADTRRAG